MKKLLIAVLALSWTSLAFGEGSVAHGSFTITNDSALMRMDTSTTVIAHVLSGVIVSSITTGGLLKIYNSTFTTSNLMATIYLGTAQNYNFNDLQMKGIFYVITNNANGVTIIYKQ